MTLESNRRTPCQWLKQMLGFGSSLKSNTLTRGQDYMMYYISKVGGTAQPSFSEGQLWWPRAERGEEVWLFSFSSAHVYGRAICQRAYTTVLPVPIRGFQIVEINRENPLGYKPDSKNTLMMPKSRVRHRRGKPGSIWQLYLSLRLRLCRGISKTGAHKPIISQTQRQRFLQ